MTAPLIVPHDVLSVEDLAELANFLRQKLAVNPRTVPTYAAMVEALGQNLGRGRMGRNLLEVLRHALDGRLHSTNNGVYSAFSGQNATKAARATARSHQQLSLWLANHGPKFMAVEVASPGASPTMVKGALAMPGGLTPYVMASTSHRDAPMDELSDGLRLLGGGLPLVTTQLNGDSLDWLLREVIARSFDHFARAESVWIPSPKSGLRLHPEYRGGADVLGVADLLSLGGTSYMKVAVTDGDRSADYLLHGPSRRNRYYLQRVQPPGLTFTRRLLAHRVDAVERCDLSLEGWPVELLRMRGTAHSAWQRMQHLIVVASAFRLYDGSAAQIAGQAEWRALQQRWPSRESLAAVQANDQREARP